MHTMKIMAVESDHVLSLLKRLPVLEKTHEESFLTLPVMCLNVLGDISEEIIKGSIILQNTEELNDG